MVVTQKCFFILFMAWLGLISYCPVNAARIFESDLVVKSTSQNPKLSDVGETAEDGWEVEESASRKSSNVDIGVITVRSLSDSVSVLGKGKNVQAESNVGGIKVNQN